MNAPFQYDPSQALSATLTVQPLTFGGLFGWLHSRDDGYGDTGVVLISPLGRDERCVHRPMRLFADRLATAGFPTLRYDHRGEGDSLDLADPDADALALWREGVDQAIDQLRARTGVTRVVLAGVRIGATLAALAVGRADGVMLLAPVLNGRSWLRRLRFSARVADERPQGVGDEAPLDTDGLRLSAATTSSLGKVDLADAPFTRAPIFVAAQNRLVGAYAAGLADKGRAVTSRDFPGFEALFLDAHSNAAPTLVFDGAVLWLEATFASLSGSRLSVAPPAPVMLRPAGAIERPVAFGAGLQGVLCQPDHLTADAPAVLFCNTGGDPRCGIGGLTTTAARLLARQGVTSLRFDFAGLGDSPMPDGGARSHIYDTPRQADLDAAASLLALHGHQQVIVVGVCAGAYHAFQFAMRDPRVAGVFAISPVKLVWRAGDTLVFAKKADGRATRAYVQALSDRAMWRRLWAGKVDAAAVARTLLDRARDRVLGHATRLSGRSPLVDVRAFVRRGGRACFVMGLQDASLDEVETYFGRRGRKLNRLGGARVHVIPQMDHGLAHVGSRQIALATLLDWLGLDDPIAVAG